MDLKMSLLCIQSPLQTRHYRQTRGAFRWLGATSQKQKRLRSVRTCMSIASRTAKNAKVRKDLNVYRKTCCPAS